MTKKIFKSIVLVSAIVLTVGMAFVLGILYRYFGRQIGDELEKEAVYLSKAVELQGEGFLKKINSGDSRITYIDENGKVLYDSQAEAESMENHKEREEIKEALSRGRGEAQRMSATLSEKTMYYAVRLNNGNILRVSGSQFSVLALLCQMIQPVLCILAGMVTLAGIFASKISRKIVDPVNALDLEHPEKNQIYEEVAPLLSKIYRQNRQIKKQLELAGQQQEEFSIITENMQEGLLVIDKYTMILSGNNSAWGFFRMKEPKTGESVYFLNRSEVFRKVIERVLEGEHKTEILELGGNFVQLTANPVKREEQVEGAVLLLVDVTEKVQRENLRREFSANVSHELKTPLTSISGFAEIIQDGFVKEEDVKKFAGRIYREASRLICLIEDIIRVSQLDEGEIPYEWENVDLYQLSENVFRSIEETARRKNICLYIKGEQTIIYTVRPVLEEVLYNLCDNAVKYNRENGEVIIAIEDTADDIRVSVKDTGTGIPKDDQDRVFERFYRVDKSHCGEVGGTGLGLSIVKHGVFFLGGYLEMNSEEGAGTQITVIFPKERICNSSQDKEQKSSVLHLG